MIGLIYFLLIGLAAGWLAGKIMKGYSFGLAGNLVVGVIGAVLGGFLFGLLLSTISFVAMGAIFAGSTAATLIGRRLQPGSASLVASSAPR